MDWKHFETQVADLFRLLGYDTTHNTLIHSGQSDVLALSPRRTRPNLLIECKFHTRRSDNVSIDDVENFVARVLQLRISGQIDQGYLITNTGFTASARGHLTHNAAAQYTFLMTFDQLLHRLIDTHVYLTEYLRRYEEVQEHAHFVNLSLRRRKGMPGWFPKPLSGRLTALTLAAAQRCVPALDVFDSFLTDPTPRLLLLLGDFGCGKTTLLRHLMYVLTRRKLSESVDTTVPIPLLITLRDYNKVPDFESLITTFLHTAVGLDHVSLPIFHRLNAMGLFVVLLDGFDEMARLVTAAERRVTFREMCELSTAANKLVISGRPSYFPDDGEMAHALSGLRSTGNAAPSGNAGMVWAHDVQLMDESQITEYLEKRTPVNEAQRDTVLRIIRNGQMRDLVQRPVLTNMIIDSAAEVMQQQDVPFTLHQLYKVYTSRWTQREEDKGYFRLLVDPGMKAAFLRGLSVQMHNEDSVRCHWRDLNSKIIEYFGITEAEKVDHFSHDIRTCSFLSRDENGYYQFIHKSFMEFFVACEFAGFEVSVPGCELARALSSSILRFVELDTVPPLAEFGLQVTNQILRQMDQAQEDEMYEVVRGANQIVDAIGAMLIREWPIYSAMATEETAALVAWAICGSAAELDIVQRVVTHLCTGDAIDAPRRQQIWEIVSAWFVSERGKVDFVI